MSSSWPLRLVLLGALAASCASHRPPPEPGVLAVAEEQSASFTRNFNPLLYSGDVRWPARHAMYEPLFIYNPLTGAYVPWLAEAYAWSEDRLLLRLRIRQGVRWSDGAPFTARDVAFTFRLLSRHPALDVQALWQHLADVRAPDDATFEISMKRPHVPLLEAIAQQPIVPEHVWSGVADPMAFANEHPIATGPFTEVTSFKNQVYEVARNPYYWQPGVPAVRALRFRAHPSNEQMLLALLGNELDWACEFIPAVERIWQRPDPHHHHWFPLLDSTIFLYPNTARKPLDDARVRKALSLAIDRALLVKVAVHGYSRPADGTGLSDAHARYRDGAAAAEGDWVGHDPARAARLLDEAGFPLHGGRRALALTIQVPAGYSDWVAAAQIISRDLRRVGVEAAVRTSDFSAWFDRLGRGDYTLALGWSELSASPYGFYRALMSRKTVQPLGETAPENWPRFGLAAADELLDALEATSNPEEERRLVVGLERLFAKHAPAIPLYPAPSWGQFNDTRFTGFPDAAHPYAPLSSSLEPQTLLVLTRIAPR
jgi:peptide/nickel transport system substrate-binding protein